MLYGHVETLADRVDHLRQLRELQDETNGFVALIPLACQPEDNDIPVKTPPTGFDSLRTIALTGFDGGDARAIAEVTIHVGGANYGVIEDLHQAIMHALAQYIRQSRMSADAIAKSTF